MDISVFDKNLKIETTIAKDDIVWLDASASPFELYGSTGANPYVRMPLDVAKSVSDGVYGLSNHTAGIRLRFRTDSPYIALHVEWNGLGHMPHMPLSGSSSFDLFALKDNGAQYFVKPFIAPTTATAGYDAVLDVPAKMTDYILNFPLYNSVSKLAIGVSENSGFEAPAKYINEKPVVFYGSSITQGGCASRPGNSYQNFLSRAFDIDYINLGFSGNGRAEDKMIDYLANLDMSVFVSDYDHNAPSAEHLENTHYKLYQGIRKKHPEIPYIIISKPDYKFENDADIRRTVIMDTYAKAIKSGDKNVYFVDGASLFADDEWQACMVDGCHPNDLGFYRFYKALYPVFNKIFG